MDEIIKHPWAPIHSYQMDKLVYLLDNLQTKELKSEITSERLN